MIRKYVLPIVSIAGVLFAIWMALQAAKPIPPAKPIADPPQPPYPQRISGAGIVEASTRNIAIGTHVSGIADQVHVHVEGRVKAGTMPCVGDDNLLDYNIRTNVPKVKSFLIICSIQGQD